MARKKKFNSGAAKSFIPAPQNIEASVMTQLTPASGGTPLRVLFMCHLHPRVSRGGAEIAAYQMFEEFKKASNIKAWFLAGAGGKIAPPLGVPIFQPFGDDEYICASDGYNHFTHSGENGAVPEAIENLLLELRPDIVHFHHYANLGLEFILYVKRVLPNAKVVVTLHEFLAICNHFGQMMKRADLAPCLSATPRDCAKCFPEYTENDFFLREIYIKRFLSEVDVFISPSQFLADRYVEWGIAEERMNVIDNGMPAGALVAPTVTRKEETVFGFFGQMSKLKGVNLLLQAAAILSKRKNLDGKLHIKIYGDPSNQPLELRQGIEKLAKKAASNVTMEGAYKHSDVHDLMQRCDAIVVPSIWWENSPLVIQEAFASGCPVICSDIGGMAEKVQDGVDGFHFKTANASDLADLLEKLSLSPELLEAARGNVKRPPSLTETANAVLGLYRDALSNAPLKLAS